MITIIAHDKIIALNSDVLQFDFDIEKDIRAIHVYDDFSEIEYNDGKMNKVVKDSEHKSLFRKYSQLHKQEKTRIQNETPPTQFHIKKKDKWILDIDALKQFILSNLEVDLHKYIFITNGYPPSTQATLNYILITSKKTSVLTECKKIFNWINDKVLIYYYEKKNEIKQSNEPDKVVWDFSKCDSNIKLSTLSEIKNL